MLITFLFFFKYKNSGRLTVELLDTEDNLNENEMNDIEKWSEYIEKYCGDENNIVNDEIKEALLAKPVFLTRFVFCQIK
jgi:hypothetical protein